ncbi:MAG: glycosyl transferase [Pseudomonadota bacterium]
MAHILVLTSDIAEAAQIRRIRSLCALGHSVCSAGLRRSNMNPGFTPDWPHLPLGSVENGKPGRRVAAMVAMLLGLLRHRRRLGAPALILARNLDMLAVATALRPWLPAAPALVYECLDIHGAMTQRGAFGASLRWAERRLLARTALLITASPGFLRAYFEPRQGYAGAAAVFENRLAGTALPPRPQKRRRPGRKLVLGWVGSLRCAPSLDLLCAVADRMGPAIEIRISGAVHRHALPHFAQEVARPNIRWTGPYRYPDDLEAIYRGCDLVWAQDLWQSGANSDWLLPNRLYEAGYFGCPALAVEGTETARRIAKDGLGFTLRAARPDALIGCLKTLSVEAISACGDHILGLPDGLFRETPEALDRVLSVALDPLQAALPQPNRAEKGKAA